MPSQSDVTDAMRAALASCPVAAGSYRCPPLGTMRALERRGLVQFAPGVRAPGGGSSAWLLTPAGRELRGEVE